MIRHTKAEDLEKLLEIFAYARETMKKTGNPNQWKDNRPDPQLVKSDIEQGVSYAIVKDKLTSCTDSAGTDQLIDCTDSDGNDEILGVFTLIKGEDPTYEVIEGGAWLNDEPYGTIHRIAAAEGSKGVFSAAIEFCEKECDNIRIDTHADNRIMQHLIEKKGFKKCGIIYVDDGSARVAYHKIVR